MSSNGRPDLLPDGAEIHRLAGELSWTAIGDRFGTSRQAVQKKWNMWRERLVKEGKSAPESPRKRQLKSANTTHNAKSPGGTAAAAAEPTPVAAAS